MTGWRRPSACNSGECIEVKQGAAEFGMVHLRRVTATGRTLWQESAAQTEFAEFVAAAKAGEYDDLTGDTT